MSTRSCRTRSRSCTTCPPARSGSCSTPTDSCRRSSPVRSSPRTASTQARARARSCGALRDDGRAGHHRARARRHPARQPRHLPARRRRRDLPVAAPRPPDRFRCRVDAEGLPPGPGFWSLVPPRDMFGVSRDYDAFTSVPAVGIFDYPVRTSIINMDPPVHTRYRLIVNKGFTPRMIGRLKENIGAQARGIVEAVAERGEGDLVTDIAARLPGQVIAAMLGVPDDDLEMVQKHTNAFIAPSDPEYGGTV